MGSLVSPFGGDPDLGDDDIDVSSSAGGEDGRAESCEVCKEDDGVTGTATSDSSFSSDSDEEPRPGTGSSRDLSASSPLCGASPGRFDTLEGFIADNSVSVA